jgi:tetratricopeptide (TPR) repeat protein
MVQGVVRRGLRRWTSVLALVLSMAGCGPGQVSEQQGESLRASIRLLEDQAFQGGQLDDGVRDDLLKAYGEFARQSPNHPFVAEALFRRADLLVSKGKFQEAMSQLQDVHDSYPAFERRAQAAFLIAFIADTHLGDKELARQAYAHVISLHPDSPEAELAEQSMVWLDSEAPWDSIRTGSHAVD